MTMDIDYRDPKWRDLCEVKRWAIVYTTRQQSVAEHSMNTAIIVMSMCKRLSIPLSTDLLKAALMHDWWEVHTGDIPSPIKTGLDIADPIKDLINSALTTTEVMILKAADITEAITFLTEDKKQGNWKVGPIITQLLDRLKSFLSSPLYGNLPHSKDVYMECLAYINGVSTYPGRTS